MPHFDIIRESRPEKSFRVESVMGTFDLNSERVKEHFVGDINLPEKWNIGLIVGRSGSGKTTKISVMTEERIEDLVSVQKAIEEL